MTNSTISNTTSPSSSLVAPSPSLVAPSPSLVAPSPSLVAPSPLPASVWFDPAGVSGVFYFILALLVCGVAIRFSPQARRQCRQNSRAQTFHELPNEDVESAESSGVELKDPSVRLDEEDTDGTAKYHLDADMRTNTLSVLMG